MTTYNTGNPIGSKDPRDLYDNAENFDYAANSDNGTFTDRLGVQRATLSAMLSGASSNAGPRYLNPEGGVFSGGAGDTTGAFKITLPDNVSSQMVNMEITIAENYGTINLILSGFNNVGGWNYVNAHARMNHSFLSSIDVRWGHDGTNYCIWIGDVAWQYWNFPQVWINNVSIGPAADAKFASGWAIGLVSQYSGSVSGQVTATGSQFIGSDAIADSTLKRILNPKGGTFTGGPSDTTGAFKIKLPPNLPQTNIVLGVTIMDQYGVMDLRIAGFNFLAGWQYTSATIATNNPYQPTPNIRFGNDGTSDCIWISDVDVDYWTFPQVWLTDVFVNAKAIAFAAGNWAISLVSSYGTVTNGPIVPVRGLSSVNPVFTGTLNGGIVNFPSTAGTAVSTYLGYQAGIKSVGVGLYNTFVGYQCGAENTSGYNNTFGGLQTGSANTTGYGNTGWGLQTLQNVTTGSFNSSLGIHALLGLVTGVANVAVGGGCMQAMTAGNNNTAIGMYAGRDNQGSNNVFIGFRAAQAKTTGDNELHIANNENADLISGNFSSNRLWVCGGNDDGTHALQVNGGIRFRPQSSAAPINNGDLVFEATSNTELKIKLKGTDGVVRTATLSLS